MARAARARFDEAQANSRLLAGVYALSLPLRGPDDLDPLLDRIGESRLVLLGEASHGTAEFYNWRTAVSERLIRERQFSLIAVEGDWPDCYRVNRYIKGYSEAGRSAQDVLHAFQRWPTWMWANEEVVALVRWLHDYNQDMPRERKIGFYGLDVYSLWDSMHAVANYLEKTDGAAAAAARRAFDCFEPYSYEVEDYTRATAWAPASCEDEVVELLTRLRSQIALQPEDNEASFNAEQNALVVKNAEHYYRTMVRGNSTSWNIRDNHMAETLGRLLAHHGPSAKAIIWEHNTHIGDARYTDMAAEGMVNVGQLARQEHASSGVVLVGFASHQGTVIAAEQWGAPMRSMRVPPARPGSWEAVLHEANGGNKLLIFPSQNVDPGLLAPRGHRAIGVVYRPQFEAFGNYVPTVLPRRYDALLYLDKTHALHPLQMTPVLDHELPETFPTGV
jgi:erythromycin esterase